MYGLQVTILRSVLNKPNGLKVRHYFILFKKHGQLTKRIKGASLLLVSCLVISIKYRWHNIVGIAEYECQF